MMILRLFPLLRRLRKLKISQLLLYISVFICSFFLLSFFSSCSVNGWWCVLCLWFLFYSGVDVDIFLFWESTYCRSLVRLFALLSFSSHLVHAQVSGCAAVSDDCWWMMGRDYGRIGQVGARERSGREMWGNRWGGERGFVNRF